MSISTAFTREIRRSPIFSSLDNNNMKKILAASSLILKEEGEMLFSKGDSVDKFYIVRNGSVRLFLLSSDGNEKTVNILRPGDSFAEAMMFADEAAYPVNSHILEDSELFAFCNKTYREIMHENTDAAFAVMRDLSMRLQHYVQEIDQLCLHTATHRLISYLLGFAPADKPSYSFTLPTKKNMVASMLSIQRETLSRIFSKLKKEKLIEVDGTNINILNTDKLREKLSCS
ncbi:MAG: Crp/Fnr family transcriptional regulator [Thiotrichales bacterium]|jgi:CRP-like cAMP-binding protein|nr:Crp/Fnr family transcriptional regulator [Thiotrichales bacterium]MBT3613888.1 Crp/Fnr family transcriptional regulator [Thiotrichales bacterium]MBT3752964.1 Crp/Fnr family transcriptional regulator [Thiotrichales bacterium]MBT3838182.1 Crp/Fnr family transcriptional regulator [Thiotrichales bacterium]MBT4151820.1 Crp/Fnr family transcriptional regulator [Thiotrichales bacterium]